MTPSAPSRGRYTLLGPDGQPYRSSTPGTLGGHRGRVPAVRRLPARAICAMDAHFTSVFAFHFTRAGSTSSRIFV